MFIQVDFFHAHTNLRKILESAKTPEGYATQTPFFSLNYPGLPVPRTLVFWGGKFYRIGEVVVTVGPIAARGSIVVATLHAEMQVV
jgi:hypothetical protein